MRHELQSVGGMMLLFGGTLQTSSGKMFSKAPDAEAKTEDAESLSIAAVDLGAKGGRTLNLTGTATNEAVVKSTAKDPVQVNVEADSTVELGGSVSQGGVLEGSVNVAAKGTLLVHGNEAFTVESVTGAGQHRHRLRPACRHRRPQGPHGLHRHDLRRSRMEGRRQSRERFFSFAHCHSEGRL